jgi:WD40 repeat protein
VRFVRAAVRAGVGLAPDGLRVVVGTASGALSLLDVAARSYTTLLRSHTAAVHCIAALCQEGPGEGRYVTAGADGTVRVWDGVSHRQLLELSAPGEAVLR